MFKRKGIAHFSAKLKKDLGKHPCRYCDRMVTISPPRAKWAGGCELKLRPGPRGGCPRFKLAKCFQK